MNNLKVGAVIAATLFALGAAAPAFAKAHNNGVGMNERDDGIGHVSGRDGASSTYVLTDIAPELLAAGLITELPKNPGEIIRLPAVKFANNPNK